MGFGRRKEANDERFIPIDSCSSPICCIVPRPLANEVLWREMIPPNILRYSGTFVVNNAEKSDVLCNVRCVVLSDWRL